MGIYIFTWKVLRDALMINKDVENCDFGMHVIPYCFENGRRIFAYEFNGYWKDVGTLGSYWEANMELIDIIPEFNLYEELWKIYTKNDIIPPQYISSDARVFRSLISDGTEVYGEVSNSIIGSGVTIGAGAVVRDSIIMQNSVIKAGAILDRAIVAENSVIGEKSVIGWGDPAPNRIRPDIYAFSLAVVGEDTVIPGGVRVGRNTAVTGVTVPEDYPDGILASGEILDKAGVVT
jgi:glucose-1-phosphate adenylyltransferase